MRSFKDANGQEWSLTVDVGAIKRARTLAGFDLLSVLDDDLAPLAKLSDDFVLLVDVIYSVCKPQADSRGVSDEQFGEGLVGDPICDAQGVLLAELADFFPRPEQRAAMRKVLAKVEQTTTAVLKRIDSETARIDELDVDQLAKSAIEQSIGSPA